MPSNVLETPKSKPTSRALLFSLEVSRSYYLKEAEVVQQKSPQKGRSRTTVQGGRGGSIFSILEGVKIPSQILIQNGHFGAVWGLGKPGTVLDHFRDGPTGLPKKYQNGARRRARPRRETLTRETTTTLAREMTTALARATTTALARDTTTAPIQETTTAHTRETTMAPTRETTPALARAMTTALARETTTPLARETTTSRTRRHRPRKAHDGRRGPHKSK